ILRCKGLADPLPHRQIRLVSEPDRVLSDVSRVAVANVRSLSVYGGKAKDRRSHQFHRLFRPRTADKCDEIVSPPSITSAARASSVGGTSSPNDLAVRRLTINSNRAACSMGRSAGFVPLRILSTKTAPRRQMWGKFTPYAARPPASQYSLNPT